MNYSVEIGKIVEGALKFDKLKVASYTKLLIDNLVNDGENRTAEKFRKLLAGSSLDSGLRQSGLSSFIVPSDPESGAILADTIYPGEEPVEIILNCENRSKIDMFINSYRNMDALREKGLDMPSTLMFSGPPGCGKTKCAEYIAQVLRLPLITARLDSLISSYLGTTAKNIRQLFEYAGKTPCILFLDEFDAIAKARDDGNDLGELKRIVNSLLQNVDSLGNESILFAATNHPRLLDPAVWRRFSFRIDMELPGKEERIRMIGLFTRGIADLSKKDTDILCSLFEGLSGAAIETILKQASRESILNGNGTYISHVIKVFLAYGEYIGDRDLSRKEQLMEKACFLHEKGVAVQTIADALGIAYGTAYRYTKQ